MKRNKPLSRPLFIDSMERPPRADLGLITTQAVGEESDKGDMKVTTLAVGEESTGS